MASQLDGLADISFQELSQLPPEPGAEAGHPLAVGPRPSRKRPLADDAEDLAEIAEVMLASPAKARRGASQRSVAIHLAERAAGTQGGRGQQAARRTRAPRSPDEKRKLSRQMAAYMRFGVLVLPPNVKVRRSVAVARLRAFRSVSAPPVPPRPHPRCPPQLNKKNGRKDDDGGLEYRQAFNLLLDVCFGDSHKAWAHCANHFYLQCVPAVPRTRASPPAHGGQKDQPRRGGGGRRRTRAGQPAPGHSPHPDRAVVPLPPSQRHPRAHGHRRRRGDGRCQGGGDGRARHAAQGERPAERTVAHQRGPPAHPGRQEGALGAPPGLRSAHAHPPATMC
jgi:hypothetical protein